MDNWLKRTIDQVDREYNKLPNWKKKIFDNFLDHAIINNVDVDREVKGLK